MSTPQTPLKIRYYGDPVLRKRAKQVKSLTDKDREVLREMNELMRLYGGVGLAATQVGITKQFLLVDVGEGLLILVNPKITKKSGSDVREEGCLSLPGIYVKVKRANKITVEAFNEKNEKISLPACDILARALQHEMDHLNGRMIIDYANFVEKLRLKKKLKQTIKG